MSQVGNVVRINMPVCTDTGAADEKLPGQQGWIVVNRQL
jgi:hypothetical protein